MTTTIPLYGRWEAAFEADGIPARGTEIAATLTAPSGKQRRIPGFWDGARVWRIRWMPDEEGEWRYQTEATGEHPGLHGQTGSFTCARVESDNPFLTHGPIRVAANGHTFEHADGTPFFYLGDTVWNGAMLSKDDDWPVFLEDRRAKKFSGIQFVTHAPWIAAYTNLEGEVAYTKLDKFPVNPHFFRRIDARIDAVNDKGLLALPVLCWAIHTQRAEEFIPGVALSLEQIIKFVRYQVARYQAHHVLWILNGDGNYTGEVAERWRIVGRTVFGETEHAPVTLHPGGSCWPYPEFQQEPWLDFVGYQSGHNDREGHCTWIHSGPASKEWDLAPHRPSIDLEPCYEDHISHASKKKWNNDRVRRNCWWTMLNAPPAGLTYGAHGIWCWHEKAELPVNHPRTGPAQAWHVAKDLPGAFDMQRMAECFSAVRWWELRPDRELVAEQPFADDEAKFVAATVSEAGDLAVLYIPVGCELKLNTGKLKGELPAVWFNPRTGERADAGSSAAQSFKTPDDEDWVLILGK